MAEYKSRYVELGFYVDGQHRKFRNGRYVTEDPKEIAVLDALIDAVRVDEPKQPAAEPKPKTEEPAPAAKAPRKSSGK
ncbi:hypothetical protein G3578_10055 [Brevibacillus sp. SYP-B805]|uniref:hypothetical protein n=1 Tax=Brevibacillus sp. SYP-B805 TaxID=1578199 RepID=UPI0013EA7C1A|nr:hypothetical protein [Brevibacillus sp. SYP-B805]NGQ95495.1 hypothetical protein [Brevibacillus sp. SYP-B805]